jgi:oligopeptide/dipeptide ABC transporter ATP-binding protein
MKMAKRLKDCQILVVKNLQTHFLTDNGLIKAVNNASFQINKGEILGLVGESGCGKSVTALSIMGLVPHPPGKIVGGQIIFDQENLLEKNREKMQEIRGNDISMIFQEPLTALNPVFTVGYQIKENILRHQGMSDNEAKDLSIYMLGKTGIPSPETRFNNYPHQLSGGMRQRAMIAMALSNNPKLLIADEPTTALDVTIQAQILDLIIKLSDDLGSAVLMITHDLGVIAETANRVAVMYAGKIVEYSSVTKIFKSPFHPYTLGLLNSIPKLVKQEKRLRIIRGSVPDLVSVPNGCSFHPRCDFATSKCEEAEPSSEKISEDHFVSCWHFERVANCTR